MSERRLAEALEQVDRANEAWEKARLLAEELRVASDEGMDCPKILAEFRQAWTLAERLTDEVCSKAVADE